ncbi:MAG: TrkH family potassium uptake protein [Bacteroidia bacterium]|nr:TrkH family potassium uptake protein [Bacteroidia bacterium]
MHKRTVLFGVARLLQVMGLSLFAPLVIAISDSTEATFAQRMFQPDVAGFWSAIVLTLTVGTVVTIALRRTHHQQTVREGFAIVGIGWMVLALFGSIPLFVYFLSQHAVLDAVIIAESFTDAVFEIMSGFTTTGSTILRDIESVPRGILFWRALTHWLGGMGIVTLALVIFPALGVSGYHMFKGEVPGPSKERAHTRLAGTANVLWGVYALLTLIEIILLLIGGMDWFDACCHSFATMATGGFSTKNLSIAAFDSEVIHWVVVVFMFLAGANFLLHYNVLRGNGRLMLRDVEFRFYVYIILAAITVSTLVLTIDGLPSTEASRSSFRSAPMPYEDFAEHVERQEDLVGTLYGSFRASAFQVVSIITTTGFCTADFDLWPAMVKLLLVLLMFIGGCAGSTGGGIKVIRILVVIKAAWREIIRMARPRIVRPIRIGNDSIEETRVGNIVSFLLLFLFITVAAALLLSLYVPDLTTSVTAVVACIANIGPGLAGVGAIENFAWIPLPGKWILILTMLLGRLEIFTILVLLRPSVWR